MKTLFVVLKFLLVAGVSVVVGISFVTYLFVGILAAFDPKFTVNLQEQHETQKELFWAYDPSISQMSRSDLDTIKLAIIDGGKKEESERAARYIIRQMYGDAKAWAVYENPSFRKLLASSDALNNAENRVNDHAKTIEFRIKHRFPYKFLVDHPYLNISYPLVAILSK